MERDFLGLSDKQYLSSKKKEVNDDVVGERGLSKRRARQLGKAKVFTTSNFMPTSDFQEAKVFPGAYKWGLVSAASVFPRGQFSGAFQNATPLLLGGSAPLPSHPRAISSGSSSPLTIFYDGTVRVFNDISSDKAQAIMLCAGNGSGETILKKQHSFREVERAYGKQIHNTVTTAATSSSSATQNDTYHKDKPIMSMMKPFNAVPSNMIPSVPQARKASLARFLEKRKERLMTTMPYKKMLLDLCTGESSGMNYSSTSPP